MKNNFIIVTLLLFLSNGLLSQHLNVTFCAETDEVTPILDANGNDQRHKGAMILDYIKVKKFGGSTAPTIWQFSKESSDWGFDNGTFLDRCENNNNNSNCSGCTTCISPKARGNEFGSLSTKFEGSLRVRGIDENLHLESTGKFNQICYTTPNINLEDYRKNSLSLEVGWEGTSEDGFSSKNVRIFYSFNDESVERWNKIVNSSSKVLGKQVASLGKTDNVPGFDVDAVNDLEKIVKLKINPNPIHDFAKLEFNSNKKMELKMHISDLLGKTMISKSIIVNNGITSHEVSTINWMKGTYIIKMTNEDGLSSIQKLLVQ